MAVTVEESWIGRGKTKKDGRRDWVVKGCSDEDSALAALLAGTPKFNGRLKRKDSECNVDEVATDIYIGQTIYSADDNQPEQGSFSISFDITGQAQKLTQSIKTVNHYEDVAYRPRNFKGAINVNSDGTVEGVDILIPYMTFQLNYSANPQDINDAYIEKLSELVGRTNKSAFKGYKECELLLTKVSGSKRDEDNWDLSFGFSVSKNKTGIKVGDIGGISKKGWEYMWVYYSLVTDQDNHIIIKRPSHVYVEQVYESGDYAGLGLP